MGVKNNEEKAPVKRILPDTLHEFLDDCIESEGKIERIKIFKKVLSASAKRGLNVKDLALSYPSVIASLNSYG